MTMYWDWTVEIAITSHKVVHVRVLFLEVLQISSRKTQVIFVIILIPRRSHLIYPREVSRYLAWTAEGEEVTITFSSE